MSTTSVPALPTVFATVAVLALAGGANALAASDSPVLPPVTLPSPPALPALPPPLGGGSSGVPGAPAPSAAATAGTTRPRATTTSVATELQRLVAAEINVVRRAQGRSRLSTSTQLTRAGQEHARQLALAGSFSHDWTDGRPFGTWMRSFYPPVGTRTWRAGENLAWSPSAVTAQQAVELWLESAAHRRVMLDPHWRQLGLGVIRAVEAGGLYGGQNVMIFAAEFGSRG